MPSHIDNPTLASQHITRCCAASEVRIEPIVLYFYDAANVRSDVLLVYRFVADLGEIAVELGNGTH